MLHRLFDVLAVWALCLMLAYAIYYAYCFGVLDWIFQRSADLYFTGSQPQVTKQP